MDFRLFLTTSNAMGVFQSTVINNLAIGLECGELVFCQGLGLY